MLPWRSLGNGEWTVHNRTRYLLRVMNLSHHPVHLISMLMQHVIPPESMVDTQTGQPLSAMSVVQKRIEKLALRISDDDGQLTQQHDH
jgi:P pilus assembly chaperone PapD